MMNIPLKSRRTHITLLKLWRSEKKKKNGRYVYHLYEFVEVIVRLGINEFLKLNEVSDETQMPHL